jgi:hypothetical protein
MLRRNHSPKAMVLVLGIFGYIVVTSRAKLIQEAADMAKIIWLRENWTAEENEEYERSWQRYLDEKHKAEIRPLVEAFKEALTANGKPLAELEPPPPNPPPSQEALIAERKETLEAWEAATRGKRSHLMTRRYGPRPKINRQGFYDWLAGKLDSRSIPARRLEAFLADHNFRPPQD